MKKGILGVISGAVSGSIIASMITLGAVGVFNDDKPNTTPTSVASADYVSYLDNMRVSYMTDSPNGKEVLSIEEIAKRVGPSVVGVKCKVTTQSYFGTKTGESLGSGIIIDEKGHIATNYHVIEGSSEITISLTSGNDYTAKVIGGDKRTDIAVLKIDAKEDLPVAVLGNSDETQVGEIAIAIGNPLATELFGTVTAGVISGVNRTMTVGQRDMTLIQTDAAISPGNSGGALINKYGEVIGINSVKLVDDAAEGLGFAIPINEAAPIISDLMTHGYVKGRPMIGISVRELNPEIAYYNNLLVEQGLYVMSVTENSGAAKAGITRGDIIIKVEGKDVTTVAEMNKIRDTHKAGDKLNVTLLRDNKELSVNITLTEDQSGN